MLFFTQDLMYVLRDCPASPQHTQQDITTLSLPHSFCVFTLTLFPCREKFPLNETATVWSREAHSFSSSSSSLPPPLLPSPSAVSRSFMVAFFATPVSATSRQLVHLLDLLTSDAVRGSNGLRLPELAHPLDQLCASVCQGEMGTLFPCT